MNNSNIYPLPEIVGILNITPDSFSDGGRFVECEAAIARAAELFDSGASVVDVGAESTRPSAQLITEDTEWERLEPVLAPLVNLARSVNKIISIDTRHESTAFRALDCGVKWINAVSGSASPALIDAIQRYDARLILMHHCGLPADPAQHIPLTRDPVTEVATWVKEKLVEVTALGLPSEKLILDPGIGFGKTAAQSIDLLHGIAELSSLGADLLIGHSRKSFMKLFTDRPAVERDLETHCVSFFLCDSGVRYLRVHEVAGTSRSIRTYAGLFRQHKATTRD
jgi:dihydropteroate synthase